MNREKMVERLKTKISAKRFEHSLGVEYTAACMAYVHGADVEKARIAGLLHDCAKGLSQKEKLEKAKKHGLPISKYEEKNPDMLHAKLGAWYAKEKYEVDDKEILSAITWHTTGKPKMSLLDKIIFVADYIEPNRKPVPKLDEIRKLSFTDLDRAVVMILENTISYLEESGVDMDDSTKKTYDYYNK
ncbi:MAG: bis(5'-nucleosyl)-tetraphosphatase (symmetrical) YqeK [Lachnospiraceae bacterium]|nr:bis(5'-nucleosyl)-tetraphosphatase (symmetrical) YqeK [Lachnospiraceae bacterium]